MKMLGKKAKENLMLLHKSIRSRLLFTEQIIKQDLERRVIETKEEMCEELHAKFESVFTEDTLSQYWKDGVEECQWKMLQFLSKTQTRYYRILVHIRHMALMKSYLMYSKSNENTCQTTRVVLQNVDGRGITCK